MIIGSSSLIPKQLPVIRGFEVEILDDSLETIAIASQYQLKRSR